MSGHECPSFADRVNAWMHCSTRRLACALAITILVLTNLSLAPTVTNAQSTVKPNWSKPERTRFRFSWGGGSAQTWTGKISITNGVFDDLAPLALSSDAPGIVRLDQSEVIVRHWLPNNYGGADISIQGDRDSQITIVLSSIENPETILERSVSLRDLVSGSLSLEIDSSGNRFSIERTPGDSLSVQFAREHLVFEPGETFEFDVQPSQTGLGARTANCRIKLVADHPKNRIGGRNLHSQLLSFQLDESGSAPAQRTKISVPDQEAVYRLELELEPAWYQASLQPNRKSIRRDAQLLVLDTKPPTAKTTPQPWQQIFSITAPELIQKKSPAWTSLPKINSQSNPQTLGNQRIEQIEIDQQPMLALAAGGWQAVRLPTDQLGRPHAIEIDYVGDGPMALGFSLLQPDASGQVPLYGFDSGVFVPDSVVSQWPKSTVQKHRFIVWPTTKNPYLLIANRHAKQPAIIGNIRVLAGPEKLDTTKPNHPFTPAKRRMMAFFETPLMAKQFGALEATDPATGQALDDWQTFYTGAKRLIEHLKSNNHRGAFVTVACDGSSIYPSQLLAPSPRYDNGAFFSTAQDPIRKDILEMLFRMFDREGLELVPSFAFTSPLPTVESRRQHAADSSLDLIDLNQQSRKQTIGGTLPIYNPLSPTVQQQTQQIVTELVARYQSHPSFDGVALVCRPDTFTLLPGTQWGYDALTVQRFWQLQSDLGAVPNRWDQIQSVLLGSHQQAWVDWRAAQMSKWYQDIATSLRRQIPDGKLYLAPVDLYQNQEIAAALSPNLHAKPDFAKQMLSMGFAEKLVDGSTDGSKIVLLAPHRIAPDQNLASKRVDLAVEQSTQASTFFQQSAYPGDLYAHRISWAHFSQLQSQSPFGPQASPLMRLQHLSPAGALNRQRFIHSIRHRDSRLLVDGGLTLATGQAESLSQVTQVFTQLPDAKFNDVSSAQHASQSPVAVREFRDNQDHYFYAVNASPWPVTLTLLARIEGDQNAFDLQSLSTSQFSIEQVADERQFKITTEISAYGLVGGWCRAGQLDIDDYVFELPKGADKELRRQVYLLQSKLAKSSQAKPLDVIANPDFELDGEPSLAGWDRGQQSSQLIRLSTEQAPTNTESTPTQSSLRMSNNGTQPVWIRSRSFEKPITGRLSISVWLKTDQPPQQPPIRLAIEGQTGQSSYYRFGAVGQLSPDPNANQIDSRWRPFAVHFDDLPDDLTNIRIGFDLMGPGTVYIDQVKVFDRWFDENDTKAITQMLASTGPLFSRPETFDRARRLLEGYWPRFLKQYSATDQPETDSIQNNPNSKSSTTPAQQGTPTRRNQDRISRGNNGEKRKPSMFRRFRNLVPQRKNTLR